MSPGPKTYEPGRAEGAASRANATSVINEYSASVLSIRTATDGRPRFQEFDPAPPRVMRDIGGQVGSIPGRPVLVFPTGAMGAP